jgi:quercetin dioxygenase-like cupin family protein
MITLALSLAVSSSTAADEPSARRMTPAEIAGLPQGGPGAGSSGVAGIRTVVLAGDPTKAGLYTIRLSVPAHSRIQPHRHRDDRSVTVVSGTWSLGYGSPFDSKALKPLPPGSFYNEPPGILHFAETGTEAAVVYITGYGPTDTTYETSAR